MCCPGLGLIATFVLIDTFLAIRDVTSSKHEASTSYAAHAGGFVAGIGFSNLVFRELADHSPFFRAFRFASVFAVLVLAVYLVVHAATMDPIKGLHTPDREDTYCCYQAMFCSGFKKADYDKFFCSYHDEDYILWRGAANRRFIPSQTPSCDELIDMAKQL